MCGLCGILGGKGHWTESQAAPDAFAGRSDSHTARRERIDRTGLVNQVLQHYRLNLKDWSGSSYVLKGGTGKTVLVDNLSQMWAEAERMTGRDLDPLDESLITDLMRAQAGPAGQ